MENWDRNLGVVLLLFGVGIVAYGMFIQNTMDSSTYRHIDLDTIRVYVGVISAVGVLLVILGVLEFVHGLPRRRRDISSPIDVDE